MNAKRTLCAASILLLLVARVNSQTTLEVSVFQPTGRITDADLIELRASTPVTVFTSGSGWRVETDFSMIGSQIFWQYTTVFDATVVGFQILLPAADSIELGPLAAGDYQVSVSWNDFSGLAFPFVFGFGSLDFTVVASCDFDADGACNVTDLDGMQSLGPLATGVDATGNDRFDLDGDGTIDLVDRDQWLADAAVENGLASAYNLGDANLDGTVDRADFLAWNGAKFTGSLAWSDGNWNGDAVVDGRDFLAWNANKFTSSDVVAVPEPVLSAHLLVLLSLMGYRGR